MAFHYKHVALAGTFDHLHRGHRLLIDKAFEEGETVSLGFTTGPMLQNKILPSLILPLELRQSEMRSYLASKNYTSRAILHTLTDIFGPALSDETFDAVVVTEESLYNARRVNTARAEKGFKPLDFIEVTLVRGNDGEVIRSSRIRAGEISRDGFSYASFWKDGVTLTVPDNLKPQLRKPLGDVVPQQDEDLVKPTLNALKYIKEAHPPLVVSVGDVITHSLLEAGFEPDIIIIDRRTNREPSPYLLPKWENSLEVTSPPSMISFDVIKALEQSFRSRVLIGKKWQIIVNGEEDLTALPALALSPLGSLVLYGQRDIGVVVTQSSENLKEYIKSLLVQFAVQ